MKRLLLLSVILFAAFSAKSQSQQLKFGMGLNLGIPANNLSGSSIAAGVDVMAHYMASKDVAITGDFGYNALFAKNGGGTTSILPLRVGLRVYPDSRFFLAGKIGAGFLSSKYSSVTSTAFSIGAGLKFDKQLELGATYDGYSKNGTIGLVNFRLGYFF